MHPAENIPEAVPRRPLIKRESQETAAQVITDADAAMAAEGILIDVRVRVINRLACGHPEGAR